MTKCQAGFATASDSYVIVGNYTAKNAQVVTRLLTSCHNLLQQADMRMRSHGLRQLVTTSLLQVVNRLVASC